MVMAVAFAMLSVVSTIEVDALHVVRQRLTYRRIDSAWGNGDLAVFEMQFNDTIRFRGTGLNGDVTMKDLNGTDVYPVQGDPEAPPTYVPHFFKTSGVVTLNCTTPEGLVRTYDSGTPIVNGLPVGLFVLHPTETPAPSLFRAIGGMHINVSTETDVREDTLSALLFINGSVYRNDNDGLGMKPIPFSNKNATKAEFDTWSCRFVIGAQATNATTNVTALDLTLNPKGIMLVDARSNTTVFNTTDAFVSEANRCTMTQMQHLELATKAAHAAAGSLVTRHNLRAAQIISATPQLYEAWAGCEQVALSKITPIDKIVPYPITDDPDTTARHPERHLDLCPFYPGTFAYESDPCCNMELADSMCCAPKANATATRSVVGAYVGVSTDTAVSVPALKMVLSDISLERRLSEQARQMPVYHVDDDWTPMTQFESYCWTAIHTQKCYHDGDCQRYGGVCDLGNIETTYSLSAINRCRVNWDQIEYPLARCYLEQMHTQTRLAIFARWGIDHASETLLDDFAAAIKARASQPDCTGPTAEAYRKINNYTYDYFGNLHIAMTDGDATGCVATKVCNWGANVDALGSPMTESQCNGTLPTSGTTVTRPIGAHQCGVSTGLGRYIDRRRRGQCISGFYSSMYYNNIPAGDVAICAGLGGKFYSFDTFNYVKCVLDTKTTAEDCLASTGDGAISPFCTGYLQELQERRALARQENGTTVSPKTFPALGEAHKFCSNPVGYVPQNGFRSVGAFCYTARSAMSRAECNNILSNSTNNPGFFNLATRTYWSETEQRCVAFLLNAGTLVGTDAVFVSYAAPLNDTFCTQFASSVNASVPFKIHKPVQWREAEYDTQDTCGEGVCQHPNLPGVTRERCTKAQSMCASSCSGCISGYGNPDLSVNGDFGFNRVDGHAGLCVLPSWRCNNDNLLSYNGGGVNMTFGPTTVCALKIDQWKCNNFTGSTYYQCQDLTSNATCPYGGYHASTTFADLVYTYLQCRWSDSVPCANVDHCLASSGKCNDLSATDCSCSSTLGCICGAGACIKPFALGATGQQQHCLLGQPNIVQVPIGCRNTTVTKAVDCSAVGYRWFPRALTAQQCADHGTGCPSTILAGGSNALLGRPVAECQKCGTTNVTNLHTFTPPKLLGGTVLNTTWVKRGMVTQNQWKVAVSRILLQREINSAAASVLARNIISTTGSRSTSLLPLYKAVATYTDPDVIASGKLQFVPLPETTTEPGTGVLIPTCSCSIPMNRYEFQTCLCRHGSITVPPIPIVATGVPFPVPLPSSYIPPTFTPAIEVAATPYHAGLRVANGPFENYPKVATFSGSIYATKDTTTAAAADDTELIPGVNYDVVVNDNGNRVGRIVGPGFVVNVQGQNTTLLRICIEVSSEIDRDLSTYPVRDFGISKPPNGIEATGTDVTETGTAFCGDITPQTVCVYNSTLDSTTCALFPVLRLADTSSKSSSSFWTLQNIILIAVGAAILVAIGFMAGCFGAKAQPIKFTPVSVAATAT